MRQRQLGWITAAFAVAILGMVSGLSAGTLEAFDYPVGDLDGQGSDGVPVGYAGAWTQVPDVAEGTHTVLESSLSYTSQSGLTLATSGGAAEVTKASGLTRQDAFRDLAGPMTTGTVYLSYLFQTDADSGPRQQYFNLINAGSGVLQIGSGDSGEFTIGGQVIAPADTDTHFFLVKLDLDADVATAWIDTELNLTSDPADGTVYNGKVDFDRILFGTLSFGDADAVRVDEIRMGTIQEVTAAVPEPSAAVLVTLGYIGLLVFGHRKST